LEKGKKVLGRGGGQKYSKRLDGKQTRVRKEITREKNSSGGKRREKKLVPSHPACCPAEKTKTPRKGERNPGREGG